MDLDRHIPGDGPVHRFDPRLKLVLAIVAIVAIALLPSGAFVALGLAVVLLGALAAWTGIGATRLIRGSWVVLPFALVVVPLLFTRPGEALLTIELGPATLSVSREGLRDAATIVLKSWASVQVALLLAYTTPFTRLLDALAGLRVPALIVATIASMYRYLAVIGEEAARMRRARAARSGGVAGRATGGGLRWRARAAGSLVGSLFIRSYERSERVHLAMLSRGGGRPVAVRLARPDDHSLAGFVVALVAIVVLSAAAQAVGA